MKLLFVHEHLGAWAGAEANLFEVATALRERGHELALLHGAPTGRGEEQWRALFPRRFPAEVAGAAAAALAGFQPELVYLHNSPGLEVTRGLAAGDVPVVRMVHDHHLFCLRGCRYSTWSREPCTRAFSPLCLLPCGGFVQRRATGWSLAFGDYLRKKQELALHRRFARLIVASEYMYEELRRNGFGPEQIEIHAPVPGRPLPAAADAGGARGNRIVFAGQIVRGKGVDVLLESLALVQTPFECVILGDGNHRGYCERLAVRLGLDRCVKFMGFVPGEEVASHYQTASLAVFSSVWPEPFGLSGLEALRHGLPVVAFDVGGVREWLEDGVNGLLAPWMDRAGFARRVETLLRDGEYARRLGGQGRTLVAERFDFPRYIERLEEVFARVKAPPAQALAR
ncbi:MAG TPA: glycosyltransferase family 4 protein [Lacunisphaera sp.]|nr:glycosyltransferase family 4 protein [Lacunisphaera sp.]